MARDSSGDTKVTAQKQQVTYTDEEGTSITGTVSPDGISATLVAKSEQYRALRESVREQLSRMGHQATEEDVDKGIAFLNDSAARQHLADEIAVTRQLELMGDEDITQEKVDAGVKLANDPALKQQLTEQLSVARQLELLGVKVTQEKIDAGVKVMHDPNLQQQLTEQMARARQEQLMGQAHTSGTGSDALDKVLNVEGDTPWKSPLDTVLDTKGHTPTHSILDTILGRAGSGSKEGAGTHSDAPPGSSSHPGSDGTRDTNSSSDKGSGTNRGGDRGVDDGTRSTASTESPPAATDHGSREETGRTWQTTTDDKYSWSGNTGTSTERTSTKTTEYKNQDGTYTYKTDTTTTNADGTSNTVTKEETTDQQKESGYYDDDPAGNTIGADPPPKQHGGQYGTKTVNDASGSSSDTESTRSVAWQGPGGYDSVNAQNPEIREVAHTMNPDDAPTTGPDMWTTGTTIRRNPFDLVTDGNPEDDSNYATLDESGSTLTPGQTVIHTMNPDDDPSRYTGGDFDPSKGGDRYGPMSNPGTEGYGEDAQHTYDGQHGYSAGDGSGPSLGFQGLDTPRVATSGHDADVTAAPNDAGDTGDQVVVAATGDTSAPVAATPVPATGGDLLVAAPVGDASQHVVGDAPQIGADQPAQDFAGPPPGADGLDVGIDDGEDEDDGP